MSRTLIGRLRNVYARLIFLALAGPFILTMQTAYAQGIGAGTGVLDAKAVYASAKDAVVLVQSKSANGVNTQGSGVVFNHGLNQTLKPASSWVVTNAHVVRDAGRVTVGQLGQRYVAKVEYVDDDLDLAILFVEGAVFAKATVAQGSKLPVGEKVFAIGSPFGLENTITEGIFSGIRDRNGTALLQNSASISSGNSGGGLFDARARLVGITTFKLKGGENLNFALDATYVTEARDALYAAGILRLAAKNANAFTDTQLRLVTSHRFTKWLLDTRTPGGLKYWTEALRIDNELLQSKDRHDIEERFHQLQVIVTRFLADQTPTPSASSQPPAQALMRLVCTFDDDRGGNLRDYMVLVDFTRGTANGFPASVSEGEIRWRHGNNNEYFAVLNRYTASLRIGSDQFSTLYSGSCSRVTQQQF